MLIRTLLNISLIVIAHGCTPENYGIGFMSLYNDIVTDEMLLMEISNIPLRLECAAICGRDVQCLSFFHNELTSVCRTHGAIFLKTPRRFQGEIGMRYHRKTSDCYDDSGNEVFDSDGRSIILGRMFLTDCGSCRLIRKIITCPMHGHELTLYTCRRAGTCSDVKSLNSSSTDGEYWLYPVEDKVKIYCHNMTSDTPSEFITLNITNYGHHPPLVNPTCTNEIENLQQGYGTTNFTKIAINTRTMAIIASDFTFASSNNVLLKFGEASDCYAEHVNGIQSCGPVGTFFINTEWTGLRITSDAEWVAPGSNVWMDVSKSNDGLIIELLCGGYCGRCLPNENLILEVYPTQEPDETSAYEIPCLEP